MTVDFFPKHESKSFTDARQLITYSFNKVERTIEGVVVESENQILIYEYRGKYIGTEFFISFSKDSVSYKLIKVDERTA